MRDAQSRHVLLGDSDGLRDIAAAQARVQPLRSYGAWHAITSRRGGCVAEVTYPFLSQKQVQKLLEEKRIEIAPLAFMRGRTLSNAFVVLDEAQNATTMQMKMFLTRLGEGSRMVITGDRTQVDLPRGTPSGLQDAERILKNVKGASFNYFTAKDVVRHPLVGRIIEAYEADDGAVG